MLTAAVSEIDQARAALSDAVKRIQRLAARTPEHAAECAVEALRAADRLTAMAAGVIARGGFETGAGLPAPIMLQMDARYTSWDARAITRIATTLTTLPDTAYAFEQGLLSWSQVRAITAAVKPCDRDGRAAVDRFVGIRATFQGDADPDRIVADVEGRVAVLRSDLTEHREQRAVERSFIAFQPMLDGRASFYGEGDAASIATLIEAVDSAADRPASGRDAPTRGRQRYDALIAIAAQSLAGGGSTRARPRLLATLDVADLTRSERDASARILWALAGKPPRLSPIGTQTLLCDADVLPLIFERGRPIAVGDAYSPIPDKIRRAVEARDHGCRFPGCHAPLAWADAHHILSRAKGGRSDPGNLIMLCRRCHRRIHQRGWRILINDDASIDFARRARRYRSPPPNE